MLNYVSPDIAVTAFLVQEIVAQSFVGGATTEGYTEVEGEWQW